jgi:hypothetical protein
VSSDVINLSFSSHRVFIVVSMNFVIDSVRKLLDTPSYSTGNSRDLQVTNFNTARDDMTCEWGTHVISVRPEIMQTNTDD